MYQVFLINAEFLNQVDSLSNDADFLSVTLLKGKKGSAGKTSRMLISIDHNFCIFPRDLILKALR